MQFPSFQISCFPFFIPFSLRTSTARQLAVCALVQGGDLGALSHPSPETRGDLRVYLHAVALASSSQGKSISLTALGALIIR